jgi:hypothetical protein
MGSPTPRDAAVGGGRAWGADVTLSGPAIAGIALGGAGAMACLWALVKCAPAPRRPLKKGRAPEKKRKKKRRGEGEASPLEVSPRKKRAAGGGAEAAVQNPLALAQLRQGEPAPAAPAALSPLALASFQEQTRLELLNLPPRAEAALPADGWRRVMDPADGAVWWENVHTGASSWAPPAAGGGAARAAAAPAVGWRRVRDPADGAVWYENVHTGASSWAPPTAGGGGGAAAAAPHF